MDLEVALLIGAAVVGIVVGVLHLVGYVPPRYRKMLSEVQRSTATAITEALDAKLDEIGPRIAAPMESAANRVSEAVIGLSSMLQEQAKMAEQLMHGETGIPPEITGAMGGTVTQDRRRAGELKDAVGRGLLGPYGALIEQFMPPLYDYLVENPDMVVQALQMPVIQKLIQGAARMAGKVGGGSGSTDNPFLKDMGP